MGDRSFIMNVTEIILLAIVTCIVVFLVIVNMWADPLGGRRGYKRGMD